MKKNVNTLVVYYSQTGNTEKIAKAIFNSIPGKKEIKRLSETNDVCSFDLVFVGFPIYRFEPPFQVKEFIQNHLKGKNIVLFMTMALTSVPKDEQIAQLYDSTIKNCKSIAVQANLIDVFDCPGELSETTAQALLKSPDPKLRGFGMLRDLSIGYPNETNISEAIEFTEKIFR
ncbi:MAG TPA: flavodoxin family protein [Bacteroidales bacterium]|nr:flavodoxin family protein [Bacteroidales bacterium]